MYSANFFSPCLMWFHPQSLRKQRRIWLPWKSKLLDWHGNMTGCWRSILKHRWVAREGFVIWGLLLKRFLSGGLPSRSPSSSPQMSLESSTTLGPYSWILTNVDFENASGPTNFIENNFSQLQLGNLGVKFVTSYTVLYPHWPYQWHGFFVLFIFFQYIGSVGERWEPDRRRQERELKTSSVPWFARFSSLLKIARWMAFTNHYWFQ